MTSSHLSPPPRGARKIEAVVELLPIVRADGTVGDDRVMRSLDREFGVDDEAVGTLTLWEFTPGTKAREPVPVLVNVEMSCPVRRKE